MFTTVWSWLCALGGVWYRTNKIFTAQTSLENSSRPSRLERCRRSRQNVCGQPLTLPPLLTFLIRFLFCEAGGGGSRGWGKLGGTGLGLRIIPSLGFSPTSFTIISISQFASFWIMGQNLASLQYNQYWMKISKNVLLHKSIFYTIVKDLKVPSNKRYL